MNEELPLLLHERQSSRPPPELRWLRRDVRLRVAEWSCDDARATVLLLPGFTEYLEKYGPVVEELLARRVRVIAADWRGHGLSERLVENPRMGWVASFDDYVADTLAVLASARVEGPLFLLAHSMGGHVGMRLLQEHPGRFERAVLVAPLFGLAAPLPEWLVLLIARLHGALGLGDRTSWQGKLSPRITGPLLTTCPERLAVLCEMVERHPELCIDRISWSWLSATVKSLRGLRQRVGDVRDPVLLLSSTADQIVDPSAHDWFAERVPSLAIRPFEGLGHELLQERKEVREAVWAEIDAFLVLCAKNTRHKSG